MRRLLLAIALLLALLPPVAAQQGNTLTIGFTGVPSGTCGFEMLAVNLSNGDEYNCNAGAWQKIGPSSGGITGSGTANTVAKFNGATAVGNSSVTDDGTNPTVTPKGSDTATAGNYQEFTVATGGTTAGLIACATTTLDGSGRPEVQTCATNSVVGLVGVALGTQAAGQTVRVCWTLNCAATFDNAATALNEAIVSPTVAGQLHDTGVQTSTAGTQNFSILTTNAGAGTNSFVDATGLLAQNPKGGGGNGRGVTSVAMTGDGVVLNTTVPGSPITKSGTLAPTLVPAPAGYELSGPTPAGASNAAVQQFGRCARVGVSTTTFSCAFPGSVVSGDELWLFTETCGNIAPGTCISSVTDTLATSYTIHNSQVNWPWATGVATSGGSDTITMTLSGANTDSTIMYVVETSPNVGALDASATNNSSATTSITTTQASDFLVVLIAPDRSGAASETISLTSCPSCTIFDATTTPEPSLLAFGSTGAAGTYNVSFTTSDSRFGMIMLAFVVSAGAVTGPPTYKLASLNLPPNPTFNSVNTISLATGLTDFNGSQSITSVPTAGSTNIGWKWTVYSNSVAFGLANNTFAFLDTLGGGTNQWLSVFGSLPANDALGSSPDSHAKVSLGTDGSIRGASTIITGNSSAATYSTATNCSSSASPAVCGSAAAGSVVIAAAATTVTVNTTAVTANSQIFVMEDDSLGTKLGVTCNTGILSSPPEVTARVAGTSFTITTSAAPTTNPACYSYLIIN